jgi:hypothetical protein
MIMQRSITGLPPPEAAPAPSDAHELVWAERATTGLAGPLLVAAENGSRPEGAVRLAELLARRHRVNAHVLAVVRPVAPLVTRLLSAVSGLRGDDLDECRRSTERARLRDGVRQLVGLSTFFSTGAKLGEFVSTVSTAAIRRRAGYVVTDLAPAGDGHRLSTAVTALRIARSSGTAVLAVPPATDTLPRSALVCTDFTEAGARAALAAAPLLADGAELTLAHIAPPLDRTADPEWVESWTLWATDELRGLAGRLGGSSRLRVYVLILRGNAEDLVARSARNFDLVALGAPADDRPYLSLGSGVLGAVLRHAPSAVLIAPDPARSLEAAG